MKLTLQNLNRGMGLPYGENFIILPSTVSIESVCATSY